MPKMDAQRPKRVGQVINLPEGQVFTAKFVWEQMTAQSRRLDMANSVARVALVVAGFALGAVIYIAIRCCL